MILVFNNGIVFLFNTCKSANTVQSLYSKTCLKRSFSKRPKIGFQDRLLLNAGQKYCRILPLEHSAILSTFNKLPFVLSIFCLFV